MRLETTQYVAEVEKQAPWYALYTGHQHEKYVAESLSARGIEVFLPLYQEVRQWSDRRKRLSLPLFPCYVFVKSCLECKRAILLTPSVRRIVSFNCRPAEIPSSEIENVRRVIGLNRMEPHPFLHCGDWVRVKFGPFAGIEGILVRKKGEERLVLSVEMLQKSAAMEIDAAQTEKILRIRRPLGNRIEEVCATPSGATIYG